MADTDSPFDRGQRYRHKNVVMASHGRAPWYTPDGKVMNAYVIGIAGGSSSGKTTVAREVCKALDHIPTVLILSQDAFYKQHTPEEVEQAFASNLDFDHPNSIDMELFAKCLDDLKHGRSTEIPIYSFAHHQRMPEKKYLYGANVIIVEGIMALHDPKMRDLYDLKIFVNCDSDVMLARRIRRDVKERGRDVEGIIDQYLRFVKSSYDNFVQPSSKYADIIVPGYNNTTAVSLIVTHIQRQLDARAMHFRRDLTLIPAEDINESVHCLPQTSQLKGIMTILRDETTKRSDFIFYTDRLATLICEYALSFLPHGSKDIVTATGIPFHGVANCDETLVGVSIMRSGGPFSHGLRRVIRDVPLGSLLIQSDPTSGEPLLLSSTLPHAIQSHETAKNTQVLLLDSQMGTGAAALMAIRVLLDHGVPESNITFLAFLIARQAVTTVRRAFPRVRIVTAAIDGDLAEVHFPMGPGGTRGEAAGDADLAVRLVARAECPGNAGVQAVRKTQTRLVRSAHHHDLPENEGIPTPDPGSDDDEDILGVKESGLTTEKVAWVVRPGMGHIGDRYYLA